MIELHRYPGSTDLDHIEEQLKELVLAYRVSDLAEKAPSFVKEGKAVYSGTAIQPFMDALSREVRSGRAAQSDGCFIDPEGEGHCAI